MERNGGRVQESSLGLWGGGEGGGEVVSQVCILQGLGTLMSAWPLYPPPPPPQKRCLFQVSSPDRARIVLSRRKWNEGWKRCAMDQGPSQPGQHPSHGGTLD